MYDTWKAKGCFKDQDFHMNKKSMNKCNIWEIPQENEGQILV
jgi:hypothetical protein